MRGSIPAAGGTYRIEAPVGGRLTLRVDPSTPLDVYLSTDGQHRFLVGLGVAGLVLDDEAIDPTFDAVELVAANAAAFTIHARIRLDEETLDRLRVNK